MTLVQLKYAIAVARQNSLNHAAKVLFISQPSLSSAIRSLEKEIGFDIFIRSKNGITLTSKGAEFIGYAKSLMDQYDLLYAKYILQTDGNETEHWRNQEENFMERGIQTRCLHLEEEEGSNGNYGAISYPIFQTATYVHLGVGKSTGYDYSRLQNPTREHLEKLVATLENGTDACAFASGMAAIALLMELFSPGDHLIVDADLYGGSVRLFRSVSEKNQLSFSSIDCYREDVEHFITKKTKAIYLETPTNPMMHVTDIQALSKIARRHRLLLIVDNTFLSPYFQNPLELGADIVVHSGTKYLGGHNDTLAGFLVTNRADIAEQLRFLSKTIGSGLSPFDSWLILRGIKTLGIRMEKAQENAQILVKWLKEQRAVTDVIYPGLAEHPGHEIMKKQAQGFGSMLTFQLESKAFALGILEKVRMIKYAESLGGVETLITYPATQTHADVPEEIREKNGITESTLRLSVGIEDVKDLLDELERVFQETEGELYGEES